MPSSAPIQVPTVDQHHTGVSLTGLLQFANPFVKPVDTKLYPDYPMKVSKPLDFGTVKSRLDAGNYTSNMESFVQDMGQIFDNAFLYNAPGSTVHGWAVTLKVKPWSRITSFKITACLLQAMTVHLIFRALLIS